MANSALSQQGWAICITVSIFAVNLCLIPAGALLWMNWHEWFGVSPHTQIENHVKLEYPTHLAPRGRTVDAYRKADGGFATVEDPYRFLEDPDCEATQKWVEA